MRTMLDAALRLGPRPVLLAAWHRSPPGRAVTRRRLRDPAPTPRMGPVFPDAGSPAPPLPEPHRSSLLHHARATAPPAGGWHGGYPAQQAATRLDLFAHGDIRPVWEANRWAALPLLAQAARLDPAGGHLVWANSLLGDWLRTNPAFRGPNWACGQEAALRALHLALACALLGAPPSPAARTVLALHGRRIAATPAYAAAQDNNHAVSEPAGLLACGLGCGEAGWVRAGAARLAAAVLRLIAPCGAFSAASTGYLRLLLDVLAVAEWLAGRWDGPRLPAAARHRAAAAAQWLWRVTDARTGATPRIGHLDGAAFADLSLAGPEDARASIERAARLFAGHGAGLAPADPGCTWLGLADRAGGWAPTPRWRSEGFLGWQAGPARAVLRTGAPRLRFRPGHADLLHLELWDGSRALLRDGGSGAYNPPPETAWWHTHFTGTAAHNTIAFDDADQMVRLGRFLFARWPKTGLLPGGAGAWLRDHRGNRHERRVAHDPTGRRWEVTDAVCGRFQTLALRWRLPQEPGWRITAMGAEGPSARIHIAGDAPLALAIEPGWHSPAYGVVRPAVILVARGAAPLAHLATTITLAREAA
jgi:hypothetical protein